MKNVVVYIGIMFLPDKNALCQRAFSILESVKDMQNQPVMIGFSNELKPGQIAQTKYDGIPCFELAYPQSTRDWLRSLYDTKDIITVLEKIGTSNIKAVILADYRFLASVKLKNYCDKKQVHFISDIMDWFSYRDIKSISEFAKIFDTWARIFFLYRFQERKICISKALYEMYKGSKKCVLIPGTIIPADKKWITSNVSLSGHDLKIAFAGVPGKNCRKERVDWVIRAIGELNQQKKLDIHFYIAGIDKQTFYEENSKLIDFSDLKNIHFLGRISHEECLELIKSSHLAVIPRERSRLNQYGFSTKISEALACGTPVLATETSDVASYVINDVNGYVCKPDYESLKQMIAYIASLPQEKLLQLKQNSKIHNPLVYMNYTEKLEEVL